MFVSRNLVKDVMKNLSPRGEQPYFRVMNGPREGQRIEMGEAQEYVFGRDDSADIVLNDDLVSRRHAKVRRDWSGTHVEDLESRNGIKVNGKRARKQTLKDRDELEIGSVRLLFIDPTEVRETPLVLPAADEAEVEGTVSVAAEPSRVSANASPPPAEEPEPPPDDPPPPDDAPAAEAADDEPSPDAPAPAEEGEDAGPPPDDLPADEPQPLEGDEVPAPRGLGKLIDLSNKQTLIALAAGGLMLLVGVVFIILLVAGA
jgi:hypothetical protein